MQHNTPTTPLSLKKPSPLDKTLSISLSHHLNTTFYAQPPHLEHTREKVLSKLHTTTLKYTKSLATLKGLPPRNYTSLIYTFGSYRLGVNSQYADIDTLVLFPRFVERTDFFTTFVDFLRRSDNDYGNDRNAKDCNMGYINTDKDTNDNNTKICVIAVVEHAYVPLIKLRISNINIDLVFARLNTLLLDDKVCLLNNSILKGMDEKCVLSVNGSRVTDIILGGVNNIEAFRECLKGVKLWAKRKGLYGNVYGYMGGVSYAICVAKICQFYPNGDAFYLLRKFFKIFSEWKWPVPVIIREYEECSLSLKIWDPKNNPGDRFHRMPVITPAYPYMCSTHNVTSSTLSVIVEEMKKASTVIDEYIRGVGLEGSGGVVGGVGNKDSNLEGVSGKGSKLEGVGDKGSKLEGVGDKDTKLEGVIYRGCSVPGLSNCLNKQQGVNNISNNLHPFSNTSNNIHSLNHNNHIQHPLSSNSIDLNKDGITLWTKLFAPSDFFTRYRFYMTVICNALDIEAWEGYVESKIRVLCQRMEVLEEFGGVIPYPKVFRVKWCGEDKGCVNDTLEGVSNTSSKLEGVSNKDIKLEGFTNTSSKLEGVSNTSSKLEGFTNMSSKLEGVSNTSNKDNNNTLNNNKINPINNLSKNKLNKDFEQFFNKNICGLECGCRKDYPLFVGGVKDNVSVFFIGLQLNEFRVPGKRIFVDKQVKEFVEYLKENGKECGDGGVSVKVIKRSEVGIFMRAYTKERGVKGVGSGVKGKEGLNNKDNKEESVNNKDSKEESVNNKDSNEKGLNNKDSNEKRLSNKDSNEESVNNKDSKEKGLSNKDSKEEGVNNKDSKEEGFNHNTNKEEGLNHCTNKEEGLNQIINKDMMKSVNHCANKQHPSNNSTNKQQGVSIFKEINNDFHENKRKKK